MPHNEGLQYGVPSNAPSDMPTAWHWHGSEGDALRQHTTSLVTHLPQNVDGLIELATCRITMTTSENGYGISSCCFASNAATPLQTSQRRHCVTNVHMNKQTIGLCRWRITRWALAPALSTCTTICQVRSCQLGVLLRHAGRRHQLHHQIPVRLRLLALLICRPAAE